MYQCLVDLLPQAAGSSQAPRPPRTLFVEFFDAPSSPLHLVLLSWLSMSAPHSRRLPLALFLCWLVVVWGPPLLPPRQTQYSVGGGSWVLRLRLLLRCWLCLSVRIDSLWVSCRWSGRPLCMLPVCLAGCSWLSGSWSYSYLLASDWCSRCRVLFVLLSPSLSLSALPCSSPLGAVPCWLRCLSLVPSTLMLHLVIFLDGCMFVSLRFLGVVFRFRSIPPSWWGPTLLFSRGALPVRSSGSVRGIGWSSWLSPLPAPGYGSSCFHGSLWFGLVLQLPSMRAPRLASLRPFGYSTVSYLGSRRYVLSSTLVFSVTLPVGSSWAPLSRFSWSWGFLQSGVVSSASWSCLRGPLECIFLLLSPRGLPLVSVSWFFFQALRMLQVFSLVLLAFLSVGLQPVSVWSCFLGLLSFRLLWFPVLSYPCGVSHFAALSLFLFVPGILVAWLVSSSVLFGGAPSLGRMFGPSCGGRLTCRETGLTYRPPPHTSRTLSIALTYGQDS